MCEEKSRLVVCCEMLWVMRVQGMVLNSLLLNNSSGMNSQQWQQCMHAFLLYVVALA